MGRRGSRSSPELEDKIKSLKPVVAKIPDIIKSHVPNKEWLKYQWISLGGAIVIEPVTAWRQGGPEQHKFKENGQNRVIASLMAIPYILKRRNAGEGVPTAELVLLPVINGNSVTGGIKHAISNYMFDYYFYNRREVLEKIYRESPVGALSATLFRMVAPFLSLDSNVPGELAVASWSNFIWTMWGIGLASWCPQKKMTFTHAQPPLESHNVVWSKLEKSGLLKLMEKHGITRETLTVPDEVLDDMILEVKDEKKTCKYVLTYMGIKLRRQIVDDFGRLGINITDKLKIKIKGDTGKEQSGDITRPIPVEYLEAPPMPLVSIAGLANRTSLFNLMEIATLVHGLEHVTYFGPKDNAGMKISGFFRFKNLVTGEKLNVVVIDGEVVEGEELGNTFREWVHSIDYSEVIVPFAELAYAIHSKNSGKEG